ncbi:MAG TPA: zinc ribbon domain-containing protein [Longimicrobiales bacterium]|nr:zinc ribbon domain-containing protein [Longimicrobiales bacterium]
MSESQDVITRFHRALVEEIQGRRPEYLHGPFTVAEIYQNLVPYSSHRDHIGVEMNGDYEDALLRLLAGEGGYVVLDSVPALRALRQELESPNPNTGLYREFAAVDVRLDPAWLPRGGGVSSKVSPAPADDAIPVGDLAPTVDAPSAEEAGAAASRGGSDPDSCRWCRAELPKRPDLNFCPFCGTDVHVVPCPGCGKELEPEWRFCISCGTEVPE